MLEYIILFAVLMIGSMGAVALFLTLAFYSPEIYMFVVKRLGDDDEKL